MAGVVTGEQEVINNILRYMDKAIDKVAHAVELTGVDVANHAKDEHVGIEARSRNRYKNRTNALTNSIYPRLVVNIKEVVSIVSSNMEYAVYVEFVAEYPFMYPALRANENKLKLRVKKALEK